MPHYEQSYKMGKMGESRVLPVINEFFGREILPYDGQYARHDFYCKTRDYELKTRTNKMTAYPDTMITMDKMLELEKPLTLLFNYRDCLAYIDYDSDRFACYRKQMFARSNHDCHKKEHLFIPVGDLTIIGEWSC